MRREIGSSWALFLVALLAGALVVSVTSGCTVNTDGGDDDDVTTPDDDDDDATGDDDDDTDADCVDADGDGFGVNCNAGGDCDDNDDAIHTDCVDCTDTDSDGFGAGCPAGADVCDAVPLAWTAGGCAACLDADADTHFASGCDSTSYTADCAVADATKWQNLAGYPDNDGDGHGVVPAQQVCSGAALPAGFSAVSDDCDDGDAAMDGCTSCADADSDGHNAYNAVSCPAGDDNCDGDADNWTVAGCTTCIDNDNDGYGANCDRGADCDDGEAVCHDGCTSYFADGDGDTHGAGAAEASCTAVGGKVTSGDDNCDGDPDNWTPTGCASCIDADGDGYGTNCDKGTDCDDADNTIHTGCSGAVGPQWPIPDTSQDLCYDNSTSITCPAPGADFYGQDAQYSTNPMSFTDNGNGTITDNVTGLMWQKQDDATTRVWADAITYCDGLTLGGHSDWRLPNEYELQSIVDYGTYDPSIDTTYFPNTASSLYWSSSTYADYADVAWLVGFYGGNFSFYDKPYYGYVRCVR